MVKCNYCNNEIPLGSWVYNTTDIERPFMCEFCYNKYEKYFFDKKEKEKKKSFFDRLLNKTNKI